MTKYHLLRDLLDFAKRRHGIDPEDYCSPATYRADLRAVQADLRAVKELIPLVNDHPDITFNDILSYLSITRLRWNGAWHYTAGQYYAIEYRAAVASVLVRMLYDAWRKEGVEDVVSYMKTNCSKDAQRFLL